MRRPRETDAWQLQNIDQETLVYVYQKAHLVQTIALSAGPVSRTAAEGIRTIRRSTDIDFLATSLV